MRRLSCVCALLVGAVLWTHPARADVAVTLNVGHALPGSSVHVTVADPGCAATAVRLSLSGAGSDPVHPGTAGSQADAQADPSGGWSGDLTVPDDLAAPQGVTVTAEVTCPEGPVSGTAPLHVDAFRTQEVALSPDAAAVGDVVDFVMTGGHGSCSSGSVTDAAGGEWHLFGSAGGRDLDAQLDPTSDMTSRVSGAFVVPDAMPLGEAVVTVHCTQTVDMPARLEVLPLPPPSASGSSTPTARATSRRTRSGITLGGGLPVVSAPPVEVDPRFPLPTLAPPVQATTAPVVTVAAVPALPGSAVPVWWLLLVGAPLLGLPWGIRRRRRRAA